MSYVSRSKYSLNSGVAGLIHQGATRYRVKVYTCHDRELILGDEAHRHKQGITFYPPFRT